MQTITEAQAAKAFEIWETRYRQDPAGFLTQAEMDRMEVATLAESSAIYFMALLREVGAA